MKKAIPVCEPLLEGRELEYVTDAVKSGWISSAGSYVPAFEKKFAEYCDAKYGVAVCNGTVALHLALAALGIGKGDEVIIPSFTMIATAFAICYTGALPVFVDAEARTWNIDVRRIEAKITKRTKAIIPVHIFGNPCDMGALRDIAQKNDIHIVEDAAEAHGALFDGSKVGSFSSIAAFSFFANKNVTTGEGGMVVTSSEALYEKCRYFKNLCFPLDKPRVYDHADIGFNYRMSNLHAAIGLAQTERADYYKAKRIKNGELYKKLLSGIDGISVQKDQERGSNVHWMNGILVSREAYGRSREELVAFLKEEGIDTRLFFIGMHAQVSLKRYGCDCDGDYPVTEELSKKGFYLPSGSGLEEDDIGRICDLIRSFAVRAA